MPKSGPPCPLERCSARSAEPTLHTTHTTAGPTEGQNNLIKATKRVGFGFRSFKHHRIRVLLNAAGVNWNLILTLTPRCYPKRQFGHTCLDA
jgi:hypothetical protein